MQGRAGAAPRRAILPADQILFGVSVNVKKIGTQSKLKGRLGAFANSADQKAWPPVRAAMQLSRQSQGEIRVAEDVPVTSLSRLPLRS